MERTTRKKTFQINGQLFQLTDIDKVFLLTDVDEYLGQIQTIFSDFKSNNHQPWIVSNPSFEIWLYYCFKNNPDTDLASIRALPVSQRSKQLKRLGNAIVPGGFNAIRAYQKMKDGVNHSLEHYSIDINGIPTLFSTDMHIMCQYLIDKMNANKQEYDLFLQRLHDRKLTVSRRNIP